MIGKLVHVAIAVPDLNAAVKQYQDVFGAFVTTPIDAPDHGVRLAIANLANTKIELITPLGDNSPIQKFLEKHPQGGIHHICYEVGNLIDAREKLKANNVEVIGDGEPKKGYRGNPVLFFNPKDSFGTLIELEQIKQVQNEERVSIKPVKSASHPHHFDDSSLKGIDGVGLRVEVDYRVKTPKDNMEDN